MQHAIVTAMADGVPLIKKGDGDMNGWNNDYKQTRSDETQVIE